MMVQVELWQLVTLLLAFLGFLFAAGRLLLSQIDRRLSDRFTAMEKAREEGGKHWDERFTRLQDQAQRDAQNVAELERTFLRFQAELAVQYVRREDYVRGQSVIEAKLDSLYSKLEVIQTKGVKNG
jgi:hypothetical protein